MKKVLCDNHPDRAAVTTLAVRQHRAGYRPFLPGYYSTPLSLYVDLCDECLEAARLAKVLKENDKAEGEPETA